MLVLFSAALFLSVSAVSAADNSSTSTIDQSEATAVSPKVTYTINQVDEAATTVKNFYDSNHTLPNYVSINNKQVTMPQFLRLLTDDVTQANSGSTAPIILKNVEDPTNPTETVESGTLTKTEYLAIAQTTKSTIDSTGKAPDYINSPLGNIRYESLVYLFSKTMNFHNINDRLPNTLSVTPWMDSTTIPEGTIPANSKEISSQDNENLTEAAAVSPKVTFTLSQINTAATTVKNFYETNDKLPGYVTINDVQVTMPQFLQLLTSDVTQNNSGSSAPIILKNVEDPTNPTETVESGTLTKTEYLAIAQTTKSTIDSTGKAPDSINSTLGNIRYESLVYLFSKTIDFYTKNNRLPNTLSVTPWNMSITPVSSDVMDIIDSIGKKEAKFGDVQGISDVATFVKTGHGDCWADSLWLYGKLTSAGVKARIMGYVGGGSGNGYRHAWVQINTGNGWQNWNYAAYHSHHCGDCGGGKPYVLIGPGNPNPSIVSTGY